MNVVRVGHAVGLLMVVFIACCTVVLVGTAAGWVVTEVLR